LDALQSNPRAPYMNILGLNFGHDAAVAVLRDGRVTAYVLRERHARIKHAMTLI